MVPENARLIERQKKDVLIVDDDDPIRELVTHVLLQRGLTCDRASDGIEALEKLEQASYTVILLDLMMPRMDGISVVSHLRQEVVGAVERPIVFLMTASPPREELIGTADIVQAVFAKPFDIVRLSNVVTDCIAAARNGQIQLKGPNALDGFDR